MKKIISVMLVLAMALSLAACAPSGSNETTGPNETTTPAPAGPATALEVLETVWNAWDFEYKSYMMGAGNVEGAPGAVETTDTDTLQYLLYVPEANLADVQSAASVTHMMNANNFTAAAFLVKDASAFAATMKDTLMNNQWMCGFPETLMVYTLGNNCVIIAFGIEEDLSGYRTTLTGTYKDAVSVYDGPLA